MSPQGKSTTTVLLRWALELNLFRCSGVDASWRDSVATNFQKRRQRPEIQKRNLHKQMDKMGPVHVIRLPKLPTPRANGDTPVTLAARLRSQRMQQFAMANVEADEARHFALTGQTPPEEKNAEPDQKEQTQASIADVKANRLSAPASLSATLPAGLGSSSASVAGSQTAGSSSPSRPRSGGNVRLDRLRGKSRRASTKGDAASEGIAPAEKKSSEPGYTVKPPGPDELYQVSRPLLERLPLELFDNDEKDLTPQQWIELGNTKYGGKGTPCHCFYYKDNMWQW